MEIMGEQLTYEDIKWRYIGLNMMLAYSRETYEMEIARWTARVDELAKRFLPGYDREFFHWYYDEGNERYLDEEEKQAFYDHEEAYDAAYSIMSEITSEGDIVARYKSENRRAAKRLRSLAEKAIQINDAGFWNDEPWEAELKRWVSYEERGPFVPL